MSWTASLRARAAATPRRIVFPESADPRTQAALTVLAHDRRRYGTTALSFYRMSDDRRTDDRTPESA